jgi:putative transposase
MPKRLKRIYGGGDLHFVTSSCYRRRPLLASAVRRNLFLRTLEQVRKYYRFRIRGYVVMPEQHFHLLMSEPERGDPSKVMHALKRRTARRLLGNKRKVAPAAQQPLWASEDLQFHFWQHRFYDFNVYSKKKRIEKLRYMHRNPVTRKLVPSPDDWPWSSYRFYCFGEPGLVKVEPVGGI